MHIKRILNVVAGTYLNKVIKSESGRHPLKINCTLNVFTKKPSLDNFTYIKAASERMLEDDSWVAKFRLLFICERHTVQTMRNQTFRQGRSEWPGLCCGIQRE